jgi:hypothetical protein
MATIIFVLVAVEELYFKRGQNKISFKFEEAADLTGAALFTVLVSVFAHGLSALPLAESMAQYRQGQRSIGKADEWDEADTRIRARKHLVPEQQQAGALPHSALAEQAQILGATESYGSTEF